MRVIKYGNIEHFIMCNKCNSELGYVYNDIYEDSQEIMPYMSVKYNYIICPICNNKIKIQNK